MHMSRARYDRYVLVWERGHACIQAQREAA